MKQRVSRTEQFFCNVNRISYKSVISDTLNLIDASFCYSRWRVMFNSAQFCGVNCLTTIYCFRMIVLDSKIHRSAPASTIPIINANSSNLGKRIIFNNQRSIEHQIDTGLIDSLRSKTVMLCRGSLVQSDCNYCSLLFSAINWYSEQTNLHHAHLHPCALEFNTLMIALSAAPRKHPNSSTLVSGS